MLFDQILGMLGSNLGNFCKTGDLGPWIANQFMGMTPTHLARSDNGHIDSVVGGRVSLGRPNVGRQNKRSGSECSLLEKFSSVGHEEFSCGGLRRLVKFKIQSDSKA